MAVVGVYTTWAQTKKIRNADLSRGSGHCFGIFVVDLKGWAVTGQEVALMEAQAYAYLDAPAASPAAIVPAYTQFRRTARLGTRGQWRMISAYSQVCGFLCASSWRVLDLLAGTALRWPVGFNKTDSGKTTCMQLITAWAAVLSDEHRAVPSKGQRLVVSFDERDQAPSLAAADIMATGVPAQPVARTTTAAATKPQGLTALPNTAGRILKPMGLVLATVPGQIVGAATMEYDEEDQEAVYKQFATQQFATQAVFEMRGFFGTGGLEKTVHCMWYVLLAAFAVLALFSLLFIIARQAAWTQQPQPEARVSRQTQTEEPEAAPLPRPPLPMRAPSETPSPTRSSMPADFFMSAAGERLHSFRDCRHISGVHDRRVRTLLVCATCRERREP